MKKNIFAPKRNEVLEAVQPQIEKLTRTRRNLLLLEFLGISVMVSALYFLIF